MVVEIISDKRDVGWRRCWSEADGSGRNSQRHSRTVQRQRPVYLQQLAAPLRVSTHDNTQGEVVTSQNLWSRYDRRFVGITQLDVWS